MERPSKNIEIANRTLAIVSVPERGPPTVEILQLKDGKQQANVFDKQVEILVPHSAREEQSQFGDTNDVA
jgi:hypothetical protein